MRTRWPVRLQALVLALLMLGGGGRLPLVDGLLFHRQGGSIPTGSTVLPQDVAAPHGAADHLDTGFPASTPGSGPAGAVHPIPPATDAKVGIAPAARRTHRPDPVARPRAPPIRT